MNFREIDTSCAIQRTTSPALDSILGHAFPVLDHGFVRVIDYMGDDEAIVQMARTSYGQGTKSVSDDRGLIRYLMRHAHTSPFEGCEIKLHVKLPVFVARQWIRHRMANVNEVSGRYSVLPGEFYFPEAGRLGVQSKTNKQGTGEAYDATEAAAILEMMEVAVTHSDLAYRTLVAEETDLAREQARIVLPLNIYTEWYWKIDLHNLFHFLKLRADPHAQWEIREYADAICKIVEQWVPSAFGAWVDYKRDAVTFSSMEIAVLRQAMEFVGEGPRSVMQQMLVDLGTSNRESEEFLAKLKLK
jgi:thymidylate synthase (FAD)